MSELRLSRQTERRGASATKEMPTQKQVEDDERLLALPSGDRAHAEYLEEIVKGIVPCIGNAMILGSRHPFLVCLVSLRLNPDMGGLLLGEEALHLAKM